jgi:hypothetical protein
LHRRVFDYQFVAMVAVVLAILTRGSLLAVAVVTAFVALVLLGCDLVLQRRRRPRPAPDLPDADLSQWIAAIERVLSTKD